MAKRKRAIEAENDWIEPLAREIVDHLCSRAFGRVSDYYSEVAEIIEKHVQ